MACDVCESGLGGSRILCMDCLDKSTVDFCSEPECLNSTISPGQNRNLVAAHTPNHSMLKVHRIIFNRDIGRVEKHAKGALEAARAALSDLKSQGREMPPCAHCTEAVSQPCWYCVDCTGEFRCDRHHQNHNPC